MKETKAKSTLKDDQNSKPEQGITKISVSGYKSLAEECSIEIAPLTILSGANSSGKSSIMQPLLLMKQTLESTYDAGSLKLNGANVRLTSTDQIFTRKLTRAGLSVSKKFTVSVEIDGQNIIKNTFNKKYRTRGIQVDSSAYKFNDNNLMISLGMKHDDVMQILPNNARKSFRDSYEKMTKELKRIKKNDSEPDALKEINNRFHLSVKRHQCFLYIDSNYLSTRSKFVSMFPSISMKENVAFDLLGFFGSGGLCHFTEKRIRQIIHVPGLRGNPERTYPVTAVGGEFIGTFEIYAASIIHSWKTTKDKRLKQLAEALQTLGLTWKVDTKKIDDIQVEVRVGRLKNKGDSQANDMVSIADVGFGLSQTLPVVVALLVAEPEQLVYLEQPEIHLHPRAQANLAQLLVDAANRGVRVVVETHSELLIRRVQSLIAEDKIAAEKVKLHWFSQDDNGFTKVTTAELDDTGAFGDWPEDFSEISLQEESRYLDAAESKLMAV